MSVSSTLAAAADVAQNPVGAAVKTFSGILKKGSPRYEGGPLISTVNNVLSKVAQGGSVARAQLESITPTKLASDKDHRAWLDIWNNEIPGALRDQATATYYVQLDPSGIGRLPPAYASSVNVTSSTPPVSAGPPGTSPQPATWGKWLAVGAVVVVLVLVGMHFFRKR